VKGRSRQGAAQETGPAGRKAKVLYIAGAGRSGSTVLGQILGGVEGFFAVGELYYLWDRGVVENRLCGCGEFFRECPFWGEVLEGSFGGVDRIDGEGMLNLREQSLNNRQLLFMPAKERKKALARATHYLENLETLYHGVQDVSQSKVLVDTSKSPAYCYGLDRIPSVDVYVVHLVRDPRATAYSWWARKKRQPASEKRPGRYMTRHKPIKTALTWDLYNFLVEKTWANEVDRYMFLRYEDFVEDPQGVVGDILRLVGEEDSETPFTGEREVSLSVNHVFSGNPSRLHDGSVTIEPDEEWKRKMGLLQRSTTALATWPGLLRYGYGLGTGHPAPDSEKFGSGSRRAS
jgi:hypothetical protein